MARTTSAASSALDAALNRMIAAAPAGIGVNSEVRSRAEQQKLWDAAVKKYGSEAEARKWVAPPGHSQHELGHAADLAFSTPAAREWAHANAAKFGLTFPLGNEPWHVELVGARSTNAVTATPGKGKPLTDQQIRDYVTSHYGYAASYLHDPDIGPILLDAAKRGLGQDELLGKLQATKWWKTHTNAQTKWDYVNETNPAEAEVRVAAQMSTIGAAAKQRGIILTPLQIHDLAVHFLREGWNPDQLNNAMMYQAKIDPNVVKANYGPYVALGQTNPEIQKVIQQAQSGQWSQAQFDAAIQNTQWFKTTAPSARDAATTQANDPAKATADQKVIHDKVVVAARNLGVPDSDPRVNQLGVDAYINGMSDADIQRKLADMVKVDPTGQANTGQTAVTVDSLKQQAAQYLVPLSNDVLSTWVDQIQRGDVPANSFDSYLKAQAKSLFPSMGAAIDKGITPSQYLDPYKSYAASILERPADSIDFLNDPKFSKAVFQVDPKTGERTAMSLSDWQTYLRGLPDYQQTNQAKDQAAQFGEQIAQTFGKVAY